MNIFNGNGFMGNSVRFRPVNLGQAWPPFGPHRPPIRPTTTKEASIEEVIVIVPRRPPPPPPPTPPLSFMMPLRQGPDQPEPPPPTEPLPPLPPMGPPVATPGNIYEEFASCKRCPDGSFKTMNAGDARAAGCVYTDPINCLPRVPSVDVRIPPGPPVASVDRYMPYKRLRETPPAPAPVTTPATTSKPLTYQDVATEGAGFPTRTGFQEQRPTYMDVETPSTPQYGSDLQRQIDSYQERLREFSERPMTPSIYEQTLTPQQVQEEARRRNQEWMQRAGIPTGEPVATQPAGNQYNLTPRFTEQSNQYNLTPQNMRQDVASVDCPPDAQGRPQFWDGRQCRGSVAPGAASLVSQAMNLAPSATVAPGLTDFAPPSMPATSFMGMVRFPVVNL